MPDSGLRPLLTGATPLSGQVTGWSSRGNGSVDGDDEPTPPLLPQAARTDPPMPASRASRADRSTNSRRDMPLATSFLPFAWWSGRSKSDLLVGPGRARPAAILTDESVRRQR